MRRFRLALQSRAAQDEIIRLSHSPFANLLADVRPVLIALTLDDGLLPSFLPGRPHAIQHARF